MTECRYFSGGLIELKCAIRGSLGSLGPREIKKRRMHLSASSFEDISVFSHTSRYYYVLDRESKHVSLAVKFLSRFYQSELFQK